MKGIRASLQGLLLVACVHVLPSQAASISINTVDTGELLRQGTFPASPSDVYSHSPTLQELSYEFIGFNPSGTLMEDRERSGYVVYDLSSVMGDIVDASLQFEVNVTDATPGNLVVNTIDSARLGDVTAAPVGPLTQVQFDNLFAALSSGVTAVSQTLAAGIATINLSLGAVGTSHLSSAAGLVGFQLLYQAAALQTLALGVDSAPQLLLTTIAPDVGGSVPSAGTLALLLPGVLLLVLRAGRRRQG